ncbi:protein kinase domain-containing protein [Cupriavidus basilensis]|uniref:protein kinase domain-containing protein n=1 Tax=Cupriavidus basilensis TaxID=68895 RepID=UPI0023E89CB8|nr:protein kinase [Cupriavidus basilensis]MDF3885524.1 protein kinase [Cupriavidus basilensis]
MNGNALGTAVEPAQMPARRLTGITLADGWKVIKMLTNEDEKHSPGFFSVGYLAEKGADKAFLKAFDLAAVMQLNNAGDDPGAMMIALQQLSSAYTAEDALLKFCSASKLDRIVRAIGAGFASPPAGVQVSTPYPVPYLLFELADGDIRKFVGKTDRAEDAWRFKHLHDVAVGLQQLHTHRIAHQDLKPANVLVFPTEGAKIADLGRASRDGVPAPHDSFPVPGDFRYAPPELRYGETPTSWVDRREASDLYHLGSLMTFVFTGMAVNTSLEKFIPEALRPGLWRGRYQEILPHLTAAFTQVLDEVGPQFPEWARSDLVTLLSQMCHPDYKVRGAPSARVQVKSPIGMDRFVSHFDRLAKMAALKVRQSQ